MRLKTYVEPNVDAKNTVIDRNTTIEDSLNSLEMWTSCAASTNDMRLAKHRASDQNRSDRSTTLYISESSRANFASHANPMPKAGTSKPTRNSQFIANSPVVDEGCVRASDSTACGNPHDRNPWRPDPQDERVPIGPSDTASMERSPLGQLLHARGQVLLIAELVKDRAQHFRWALAQGALCDVARRLEHLFDLFMFFIHTRIVGRPSRAVDSYFPNP